MIKKTTRNEEADVYKGENIENNLRFSLMKSFNKPIYVGVTQMTSLTPASQ